MNRLRRLGSDGVYRWIEGRAQALRGLVFIAANCYAAIGVIDYPERWCLPGANAATLDSVRVE